MSEDHDLTLEEKARLARKALAEEFWLCVLKPELERRMDHHTEMCCAPDLPPHKRGEHIEARNLCRYLLRLPESILRGASQEKNAGSPRRRHPAR